MNPFSSFGRKAQGAGGLDEAVGVAMTCGGAPCRRRLGISADGRCRLGREGRSWGMKDKKNGSDVWIFGAGG